MTEVLRKMLVAGAAVAALSVAACGQPADTAADTNTEVAADAMTNDTTVVTNDTTVVTNDAVVTNDTTVVTNDTTTTTNTTAE